MKKKILSLLIGLMMAVPAYASVAVAPLKIEINAKKIKANYATQAIEIRGDKAEVMRFKVYTGYFKISDTGEAILYDKETAPDDLSKRVRFVPSEFTIQPGKSQKLRVNIANLNSLPDGESRTMLYIEDVNPKEFAIPTGQAGIGAQLIVKTRVGVPIYVDKGRFTKIGEIEHFNMVKDKDGLYTDIKVLSKGTNRINCEGKIQVIDGKKLIAELPIDKFVVGGNNSIVVKQKIDTKDIKGIEDYTIRAVISYDDGDGKKKVIKKETTLNTQGKM